MTDDKKKETPGLQGKNVVSSSSAEGQGVDNVDKAMEAETVTSPESAKEAQELANLMSGVPLDCIKGGGSVQENRCTNKEILVVINQSSILYGIDSSTAAAAIGELIRRGGANASTPDSLNVEIYCPHNKVTACVEKREIVRIIKKYVSNKTMRNLAEGMAESIVLAGLSAVKSSSTAERPGDLAKKIENRVTFKKQTPLTREERVGLASYAQWLPNLDELCGSKRVKSLLAEDLDLRKTGRLKSQQLTNPDRKPSKKKKGGSGKGKKK